jgi:hypothetical protein
VSPHPNCKKHLKKVPRLTQNTTCPHGYLRQGLTRPNDGNIQGTFREHSGKRTFGEHSGTIQGTFREENIQGPFRDHSGTIQGPFRDHSGNIQGTFRDHAGTIQGPFREHLWK